MKTDKEITGRLIDLWARAEAFLNQNQDAAEKIPHGDVRYLIEDLQIHQIELEKQNEELRRAQVELKTSIKRMQAALHEGRNTIQAIIDASTESALLVDNKGTVVVVNDTAAGRLGRKAEEMVGKNAFDFLQPDVSNNRRARLNEVIASRRPVHFVDERSGKRYHHSLCPVCDPKGNVEKVAIFGQDVTLQYQAMNDMLESESKYRLVVDHATIGIVVTQDGQLKFVNPQAANLAGYPKAELTFRPFIDFVHPDDRAMVMEYHVRRLKGQDVPQAYHIRIISKDGQTKWLENKGVLITWEDNPATLSFLVDITERKQAEKALRKSEEKHRKLYTQSKRGEELYRSLLQSSADAIVICDLEGRFRYISPAFTEIFGWTMEEVEGKHVALVPESEKDISMAHIKNVAENGTPCRAFETKRYAKDGQLLYVSLSASRYNDHEGQPRGILVVLRDISESKRLEAQFQQAQKMELLGHVAAGIAHEIRNPLSGVNVLLGAIKEGLEDPGGADDLGELIVEAQNASIRIESVIKRVLDFSRPGAIQLILGDINAPIKEAIKLSSVSLQKGGIQIETALAQDLPEVYMDHQSIQQVILNLIANASEALRDCQGSKKLYFVSDRSIDHLIVKVCDSGPGILPEIRGKIFDPFYTTKPQGSGIGLNICQRIIANHAGTIGLSASDLGGAEFVIRIPIEKKSVHR